MRTDNYIRPRNPLKIRHNIGCAIKLSLGIGPIGSSKDRARASHHRASSDRFRGRWLGLGRGVPDGYVAETAREVRVMIATVSWPQSVSPVLYPLVMASSMQKGCPGLL